MQDITVYISLDTAFKEREALLSLIPFFEGAFAYKECNKVEDVAKDLTTASSPTLAAAQGLFDQIRVENCPDHTKKAAISGLALDSTAKATTDALDILCETHDDRYFLVPVGATDTVITALSIWASAVVLTLAQLESGMVGSEKLLVAQTKTESLITTAMKVNEQTVIRYNHNTDGTSIPAAWVGRVAPSYPTNVTWEWKELFDISVIDEKGTDCEDLLKGRYNAYTECHEREYMSESICMDGDFIGTVIGRWWIKWTTHKCLVNELVDTENTGHDDGDFATIVGVVIAALGDVVDNGTTMKQNGKGCCNVVIPKCVDATDEQARNCAIPPIEWEATIRGGIHGVEVINTLTAALVAVNE